jgi:hypothetical protein
VVALDVAAVDLPPVSGYDAPAVETESGGDTDIEVDLQPTDTNPRPPEPPEMSIPDCGPVPCEFGNK